AAHLSSRNTTHETVRAPPYLTLVGQRGRPVNHDLVLDEAQMRTTAELCICLDGLPLAIELAASRLNILSPQELLERLDERLDLLHWSVVDSDSRHQTLRGAISWSYDLLNDHEQIV